MFFWPFFRLPRRVYRNALTAYVGPFEDKWGPSGWLARLETVTALPGAATRAWKGPTKTAKQAGSAERGSVGKYLSEHVSRYEQY